MNTQDKMIFAILIFGAICILAFVLLPPRESLPPMEFQNTKNTSDVKPNTTCQDNLELAIYCGNDSYNDVAHGYNTPSLATGGGEESGGGSTSNPTAVYLNPMTGEVGIGIGMSGPGVFIDPWTGGTSFGIGL